MIIILNGPAGCGKDTIGRLLVDHVEGRLGSFKEPMFNIALAASGIDESEWFNRYDDRELKELPWDKIGGLTQREFMIKISEEWIKPLFGKDHFGKVFSDSISKFGMHVVTDGGFYEEVNKLADEGHQVLIVRLHRDNLNFEGDSRSHLNPESGKLDKRIQSFDYQLKTGDAREDAKNIYSMIGDYA